MQRHEKLIEEFCQLNLLCIRRSEEETLLGRKLLPCETHSIYRSGQTKSRSHLCNTMSEIIEKDSFCAKIT